jgi:hypothetical protein
MDESRPHPGAARLGQPQRDPDHFRPRPALFGDDANEDQVCWLDGAISRFGRSYTGEPDRIAEELARDSAVRAADTVLLTVPSQLGVDYNAAMLETIAHDIAPAIGWARNTVPETIG